VRAEQRVLHQPHARLVGLRRDDLVRHGHELGHLGRGAGRLHQVHVHLVAVKVGVVRVGSREVEPEGVPRHEHDAVADHAHAVEQRLPVEDDDVALAHVAPSARGTAPGEPALGSGAIALSVASARAVAANATRTGPLETTPAATEGLASAPDRCVAKKSVARSERRAQRAQ